MGLLEKNSILASIHGSVGHLTVVHQKGRVWTRNKPTVKPKATPRRKAHRGKLGRASKWAGVLLGRRRRWRPSIGKRLRETDWSWQNLAIADYMHGPVIEEIAKVSA
jgi:hypothetical protein